MKRWFSLLLALCLLLSQPLTVSAHDYVRMDKTDCTIEVLVRYEGEDITGGTLTAIRVGYVYEDDGNYSLSGLCAAHNYIFSERRNKFFVSCIFVLSFSG